MQVSTTTIGDVDICWATNGGDGLRVLYVNGSGSDLRDRPNIFDGPLGAPFELVSYDHRGLGRSTPGPTPPTMTDFAGDLLGLIDHLGWDTCRAVGTSFGGMVLMDAASRAPERFERIVLACTSPGGAGGSSFPLHTLVDLDPAQRQRRWVDVLDVRNVDPDRHATVLAFVESMAGAAGPAPYTPGEVAQLVARADHDCWDRLPVLAMPVLVAAGRHDGIATASNQEAMMTRLPNARLAWFEGGHAFFVEDRRAFPTMIEFLAD